MALTPGEKAEVHGVCDVHRLCDKDVASRKVRYCSVCKSWICDECRGNWPKRAKAALLKGLEG